jgi:hypothetical protein
MQAAILKYIREYKVANDGISPSYHEIGEAMHIRPANAHRYVQALVRKGKLSIGRNGVILVVGGQYIPPDRSIEQAQTGKSYRREDVVRDMYKSQKGKCWWCERDLLGIYHVDHRVPLAKGGPDEPGNLCLACPDCNSKKSDKMPHEFNGRLL